MDDFKNIKNGLILPSIGYADQPKLIEADNGTWVYSITTGKGAEGTKNTFVGIALSRDLGKTWSELKRIDDSPFESSYSSLFKTDFGRIYCFYDFNADGLNTDDEIEETDGTVSRAQRFDMGFGIFCFKYSDDNGQTWSKKRFEIPMRDFDIDFANPIKVRGKTRRCFWNVSNPFALGDAFYHPMNKIMYQNGDVLYRTEGVLLKSDNLLTEKDPEKIRWETLPEGTKGIQSPAGTRISEEHCFIPLSDGTIYDVFRTIDGMPGYTRSQNGGRSFDAPRYQCFADGTEMKHPRAANFVWKCKNGKYLYWFHNTNGEEWGGRNPAWLCGGVECDSENGKTIKWSKPEIVLFSGDKKEGMSYPDLFECGGSYYLAETQKTVTRLHKIPKEFLSGLWSEVDD